MTDNETYQGKGQERILEIVTPFLKVMSLELKKMGVRPDLLSVRMGNHVGDDGLEVVMIIPKLDN